jgi:arylsulfatase A-like enzyme
MKRLMKRAGNGGVCAGRSLFICVIALTAVHIGCESDEAGAPPLVVLVTIDTLRADHLGAYGYPRGVSPFLDELAENSVVFQKALSSSSHTAPSHASLFTSLHPAQHRLLRNGEVLSDDLLTLSEVFQKRGYETAAFTPVKFLNGLAQGFDQFVSGEVYAPAEEVLGWARDRLAGQRSGKPLFIWIHLFDVHEWYQDHHVDHDATAAVESAAALQGTELLAHLRREHGVDVDRFPGRKTPEETVNLYDGQLWRLDRELGRFFRWVDDREQYDGSLWIVTSDHGEGLGNHSFLGHGKNLYNEQLWVPLIIHSTDGSFEAGTVESGVQLVDVAPTLAELIGGGFNEQSIAIEGRSLVPLLFARDAAWESRAAFAQRRPVDDKRIKEGWVAGEVFAFQDERRKMIVKTEGATEVYDLVNDRFEKHDLAGDLSDDQHQMIEELKGRYRRMMQQGEAVGDGEIQPEYLDELKALGYI